MTTDDRRLACALSLLGCIVSSGGSRHVVASATAALLDKLEGLRRDGGDCDLLSEVEARLGAIRPAVTALVNADADGSACRSARLLVDADTKVMRDAAEHLFGLDKPFADVSPREARRRGRRRGRNPPSAASDGNEHAHFGAGAGIIREALANPRRSQHRGRGCEPPSTGSRPAGEQVLPELRASVADVAAGVKDSFGKESVGFTCEHECSDDEFDFFPLEEPASTVDFACAAEVTAVFNASPSCRLVWQPKSHFFDRMGGQVASFAEYYAKEWAVEVRKHDYKKKDLKNSPVPLAALRVVEVHGGLLEDDGDMVKDASEDALRDDLSTEIYALRDLWRPGWREADAASSEPRAPSAASQRAGLKWVRQMVQLAMR